MPPQISDDEGSVSDVSMSPPAPAPVPVRGDATKVAVEEEEESEPLKVESEHDEEEEEDDDDDDLDEGEYVVEKICSHLVDAETGEIKYEVKWEGWEKKSDRTWEAEENLATASKVLSEYLESVGGKEAIMAEFEEKKDGIKKGKKRGRASTGTSTPQTNGTKKSRKNGSHPLESTPPASAKKAEFRPPSGNWEESVVAIDCLEGKDGNVWVYLTWESGDKTRHPLVQVYKRCPQKMLKFYESHLVFKKNIEDTAVTG